MSIHNIFMSSPKTWSSNYEAEDFHVDQFPQSQPLSDEEIKTIPHAKNTLLSRIWNSIRLYRNPVDFLQKELVDPQGGFQDIYRIDLLFGKTLIFINDPSYQSQFYQLSREGIREDEPFGNGHILAGLKRIFGVTSVLTTGKIQHEKLLQFAFKDFGKLSAQAHRSLFAKLTETAIDQWRYGEGSFEALPRVREYVFDCVSKSLLGYEDSDGSVSEAIQNMTGYYHKSLTMSPHIPLSFNWFFKKNEAKFNAFVHNVYLHALNKNTQSLITKTEGGEKPFIFKMVQSQQFSSEEIHDMIKTICIAGLDSTVSLLLFCLWKLPEWETELRKEIQSVLGKNPDSILETPIESLEHFIKECARHHPSALFQGRDVQADFQIEDYTISKGSMVFIPHFISQLNEKVWGPTAKEFNPHRFHPAKNSPKDNLITEQALKTLKYFGSGAHPCLGRHFALEEIRVFLLQVLLKSKKVTVEGHDKRVANFTYTFEKPFKITLEPPRKPIKCYIA